MSHVVSDKQAIRCEGDVSGEADRDRLSLQNTIAVMERELFDQLFWRAFDLREKQVARTPGTDRRLLPRDYTLTSSEMVVWVYDNADPADQRTLLQAAIDLTTPGRQGAKSDLRDMARLG